MSMCCKEQKVGRGKDVLHIMPRKNKENKRHPKKLHERTSIDFMTERTQEKERRD